MPFLRKLLLIPKAVRQLGRGPLLLYVRYQIKLRSGILRMQTPRGARKNIGDFELREVIRPANKEKIKELLGKRVDELFAEADEIFNGQVRLFGTASRKLELSLAGQLEHWTHYHSQMPDGTDIKPIWEAGRFGWATVLARAYWLSGEERFAEGFWKFTEQFLADNPPNKGPHWSSAQEVALRLISLAFWYSLVADSVASTSERKQRLVQSVIAHAERIPPTLDYARAQNNNHLLSEALGLCTAAALLPDHPKATRWNELGRKYFFEGIESQIHEDGSYAQHSANYHRLMLQLSLWANKLLKEMPLPVATKLARSTDWLLTLLDEESGRVPNLGPNDGAYILPLSVQAFEDYRPALQAASLAFRGGSALANGIWDEMALWFGIDPAGQRRDIENGPIRIEGKNSWAYLRAAQFQERPGHADQLHLDLWWRGLNIAQDAGSYLYTAPQPWDNALTSARVHNTLTVSGREPMTRAGRFLWLDWAQGKVVSAKKTDHGKLTSVIAEHDGYAALGLVHRREVSTEANRWLITDRLLPKKDPKKKLLARLHWLLPDWDWQLAGQRLQLESPHGVIEISIDASVGDDCSFQIVRAGEFGSRTAEPIAGWFSPTYGVKVPALSFIIEATGLLPITLTTTWTLPD